MKLQCHKCESNNTQVVNAEKLGDETNGKYGFADLDKISPLLMINPLILGIGNVFKAFQKKDERKIVLCKDCGYWEKV